MDSRERRFGDPRIRHFGAGESYRPDRRPSPPPTSYRREPDGDNYVPSATQRPERPRSPPLRRRSRSPFRDRDGAMGRDGFARERSPPRFPRERYPDEPPRSPPRRPRSPDQDSRYAARRSPGPPVRPRSPDPRARPYERDERFNRGGYDAPPRGPYDEYDNRRDGRAGPASVTKESQTSSRRSSPPFHSSRAPVLSADNSRAPSTRPDRPRSPLRGQSGYAHPRDDEWVGQTPVHEARNDYPAGPPARDRDPRGGFPPAAPPMSMSAHNRPYNMPYSPGPPGGPRGGPGPRGSHHGSLPYHGNFNGRPPPRNFSQSYQGPPPHHQVHHQPHHQAHHPPHSHQHSFSPGPMQNGFDRGGPRGPPHSPFPPSQGPAGPSNGHGGPPFRNNNSSSKTYPLTQRFNLNNSIVPGGKLAPPSNTISPEIRAKLKKLEEDSERLRRELEEKESKKRKEMREWDRMQREVKSDELKSAMAEEQLDRMQNGEEDSAF